jgi:DNA-binding MarR family transcriptional regulator
MSETVPPTVAGRNPSSGQPHAHHPHAHDDEEHRLVWLLLEFVRAFGLHRPDLGVPGVPVSVSEALALAELVHAAPASLTQQQLAERLHLDKSTVSRLAASLQRRGLVTHARDPANRRWSQLALTPRGQATATGLIARFHQHHQRLFAAMRPTERQALATGLTALVRAAADHPDSKPSSDPAPPPSASAHPAT